MLVLLKKHLNLFWLVAAVSFFNALTPIATKVGVMDIPPVFFLSVRFLLAALLLSPFFSIKKKDLKHILVLGSLFTTVAIVFFYSYRIFSPGLLTLISEFPFSILLAVFIFKERLTLHEIIGISIAFLGLFLITHDVSLSNIEWIFLPLFGSLCVGLYLNYVKKYKINPGDMLLGNFLVVGVLSSIWFLIMEPVSFDSFTNIPLMGWGALIWLLLYETIFLKFVWAKAIESLPIHKIMPLAMITPPMVVLLDYLLLGTVFTTQQLIGVVVILGGVFIAEHKSKHAHIKRPFFYHKR